MPSTKFLNHLLKNAQSYLRPAIEATQETAKKSFDAIRRGAKDYYETNFVDPSRNTSYDDLKKIQSAYLPSAVLEAEAEAKFAGESDAVQIRDGNAVVGGHQVSSVSSSNLQKAVRDMVGVFIGDVISGEKQQGIRGIVGLGGSRELTGTLEQILSTGMPPSDVTAELRKKRLELLNTDEPDRALLDKVIRITDIIVCIGVLSGLVSPDEFQVQKDNLSDMFSTVSGMFGEDYSPEDIRSVIRSYTEQSDDISNFFISCYDWGSIPDADEITDGILAERDNRIQYSVIKDRIRTICRDCLSGNPGLAEEAEKLKEESYEEQDGKRSEALQMFSGFLKKLDKRAKGDDFTKSSILRLIRDRAAGHHAWEQPSPDFHALLTEYEDRIQEYDSRLEILKTIRQCCIDDDMSLVEAADYIKAENAKSEQQSVFRTSLTELFSRYLLNLDAKIGRDSESVISTINKLENDIRSDPERFLDMETLLSDSVQYGEQKHKNAVDSVSKGLEESFSSGNISKEDYEKAKTDLSKGITKIETNGPDSKEEEKPKEPKEIKNLEDYIEKEPPKKPTVKLSLGTRPLGMPGMMGGMGGGMPGMMGGGMGGLPMGGMQNGLGGMAGMPGMQGGMGGLAGMPQGMMGAMGQPQQPKLTPELITQYLQFQKFQQFQMLEETANGKKPAEMNAQTGGGPVKTGPDADGKGMLPVRRPGVGAAVVVLSDEKKKEEEQEKKEAPVQAVPETAPSDEPEHIDVDALKKDPANLSDDRISIKEESGMKKRVISIKRRKRSG